MSSGPRFVEIPAEALLTELRSIAAAIKAKGGHAEQGQHGREIVFNFVPPPQSNFVPPQNRATVRVYTTLAAGADVARDCGEDAVRLLVGVQQGQRFKSIDKPRKMLRTAPQGGMEQHERVRAFLDRLTEALRQAYATAAKVPLCPHCNSVMAVRKAKRDNREFYGCLNFPECRGTRPKAA